MGNKRKGRLRASLSNIIFQYELITCMLLFEPWERYFINGIVLTVLALISYSSCVYLPHFIISLITCFGEFLNYSYSNMSDEL